MGCFADATAARYRFTRQTQDEFAAESVRLALRALETGAFESEVIPVTVKTRKGETVHVPALPVRVRDVGYATIGAANAGACGDTITCCELWHGCSDG